MNTCAELRPRKFQRTLLLKSPKADKILDTTPKKVETPTRKKLSQQLKRARIESDDGDSDASPVRGRRNKKQKKE